MRSKKILKNILTAALLTLVSLTLTQESLASINPAITKAIDEAIKPYENLLRTDLLKIAFIESSLNVNVKINYNKNNTFDVGVFQINSVHWFDECRGLMVFELNDNAKCAAKLLSKHSKWRDVDDDWLARYHSRRKKKKKIYVVRLEKAEEQLCQLYSVC